MKSDLFKKPLPYLAILIAHIIWGINFVVAKVTLVEIPTMTLAFLRFSIACLLIAPFLFSIPYNKRKVKLVHLPRLFLIGLLMVTFNIALFYEGLMRTSAISASALHLTIPVLSVLFGWWILKEKIYVANLTGIGLGLLGSLLIVGIPLLFTENLSFSNMLGNLLIILCVLSFVFGATIAKEMMEKYRPLIITAVMFAVGAITFAVPAIVEYIRDPSWVSQISIYGFLGLLYIVVLSTVCAFFLYTWGVSKTDVIQANLFQYIEPAIAATLAVPILGERISFSFIIGTCLIILGVYWGTLGKPEHHHIYHKHHRN